MSIGELLELSRRNDELEAKVEALEKELAAAKEEGTRLRTALEWYAHPCSKCEKLWEGTCHGSPTTAREALSQQSGGSQ